MIKIQEISQELQQSQSITQIQEETKKQTLPLRAYYQNDQKEQQYVEKFAQKVLGDNNSKKSVCKLCLKVFKQPQILTQHIKLIHKMNPYYCLKCDKSFQFIKDLKHHMIQNHFDSASDSNNNLKNIFNEICIKKNIIFNKNNINMEEFKKMEINKNKKNTETFEKLPRKIRKISDQQENISDLKTENTLNTINDDSDSNINIIQQSSFSNIIQTQLSDMQSKFQVQEQKNTKIFSNYQDIQNRESKNLNFF